MSVTLLADVASVELFADGWLTVMTDIFFPETVMSKLYIRSVRGICLTDLKYTKLKASVK